MRSSIRKQSLNILIQKSFLNITLKKLKFLLEGVLKQTIEYDFKNQKIASSGDVNWVIDFLGESTPLDPISSGFQIRENVKKGLTNFEINLIKLDEGLIYKSSYSVVGEEVLEIKDTKYPCIVLERTTNNRKTLYYVAKTLDFILIKVEDDRKERMLSIEAEKILSFG